GLVGASIFTTTNDKQISLSYVEWYTEVASTHVVAEVLKDMGYDVKTTPLDNAIMWESVDKGETDAMVGAMLQGTHAEQYKQYKDKLD
ncbi:glycine betaine ABC transporter substrate-binding protein, partial [Enterococcus faecalis]|uniref:glycine betaine ABC transporter substrate-binding protein n=1 Tax=Enterococcus faecalis TaxID=1351 RepID=UPI00113BA516